MTQQTTLRQRPDIDIDDTAQAYLDLALTPAVRIEPCDYQQAALDAWRSQGRQGGVVLPTGSGKTFLGLQAIADARVSTLLSSMPSASNSERRLASSVAAVTRSRR